MKKMNTIALALSTLVLMATSASAQNVGKGSDVWNTPGDGSTSASLNLPLDFFGPGCTFQGTVVLKGVPIVTSPAGAFGNADTVVERLQDAVFDADGVALVPIRVRALRFKSTQDLSTPCGSWSADVNLANPQADTRMTITRTSANGGSFDAPISVSTVWTFTNTNGDVHTLNTFNTLNGQDNAPIDWRYSSCPGAVTTGGVVNVDSDGDGVADLAVNGISNFYAGYTPTCQRLKPCRGKNIDPATHCYQGASKTVVVADPTEPTEPEEPVSVE